MNLLQARTLCWCLWHYKTLNYKTFLLLFLPLSFFLPFFLLSRIFTFIFISFLFLFPYLYFSYSYKGIFPFAFNFYFLQSIFSLFKEIESLPHQTWILESLNLCNVVNDGVNLWYFKFRLFDLPEFKVCLTFYFCIVCNFLTASEA